MSNNGDAISEGKCRSSWIAVDIFLNRHQKSFGFLTVTVLFLALHCAMNVRNFPYDAGEYWAFGHPSVFFNFPAATRGYFLPLMLLPAQLFSSASSNFSLYFFRIYTSIIYAFVLAIIFPEFYVCVFGGKINFIRRMIVPILMTALFPGVIVYPLSDLPALILFLLGLNLLLSKKDSGEFSFYFFSWIVLSGILIGAAYNTRTIYVFSLVCTFAAIPLFVFKNQGFKIKAFATLAFVLGLACVSFPQAMINLKNKNTFSPMVLTASSDKSLFALQLMWGITMQRYETVIDPAVIPARYYMDRAGLNIFEQEKLTRDKVGLRQYFSLVSHYPMNFFGIYVRHMINGLDLRDGEVYIRKAQDTKTFVSIVNFTVMFAGLCVICIRRTMSGLRASPIDATFSADRRSADKSYWVWLGLIMLPIAAIIPGAVETRFFLPAQILIYGTLAFNCSWRETNHYLRENWLAIVMSFGILSALFFALTTGTMAAQQYGIDLMYKFIIAQ